VASSAGVTPTPPHVEGADAPENAPEPESFEPEPQDLFDYAYSSLIDRMVLIHDHLAAIDDDLLDVLRHQAMIRDHCSALKHLLERDVP
jgi:hypothetical protein